ncbi:amidohydrolase [Candidatus Thorarchaeota archaeon]|nr:MAG: amidohydrolase [Candidatus Thorarchaeota archaeon]
MLSKTTAIENAFIVTADEELGIIERGYIRIEDDKIVELGEGQAKSADNLIDASGCVVIPGLITAHTHLYGILLRGASLNIEPPTDFAQVLQRVWWPVDEALDLNNAEASALSASADMLRNGSTFFADTYSGPNSIENSLDAVSRGTEKIGIRSMLAFEMTERHNHEEAERGLKESMRFIKENKKENGLTSTMMSLHASFTVDDEMIKKTVDAAKNLEVPITIHTSEGLVDLYHNLEKYGERTIERLDRLGVLGKHAVLAHCVHVNEHELDLVARSGASIAHNPMSNMLNAVGTAPVPEMLQRGITVGLGNDGWVYDPFENMRCALTVHRLANSNPSIIGEKEVFEMATISGARCYGVDDKIGSLQPGKLADIVILDATRVPTPITSESVIGHLVNTFSGRDVRDVLVDGKVVLKNQKLQRLSDEEVSRLSRESASSLWNRLR